MSDYDHVRDFVSGRVNTEGLDINFQICGGACPNQIATGKSRDKYFCPSISTDHQHRTRSHAASNRVSAAGTRILKIGERRLLREIESWWPKIREIERLRRRHIKLTARNVARILVNGKHPLETGLAGCPRRIRTRRCRIRTLSPTQKPGNRVEKLGNGSRLVGFTPQS